ncbi:MAG: shikimate kinase, partial [Flavobacteriaceae bacterium]|nr:shikimate kinase [Flavobacteriaceae bacterium]
ISVYLKASIRTLTKRLISEMDKRPLLNNIKSAEELTEFIGKHLFERNNFYNQADVILPVDNKSEKDILEELLFTLF